MNQREYLAIDAHNLFVNSSGNLSLYMEEMQGYMCTLW
jgi:hypothetical protein